MTKRLIALLARPWSPQTAALVAVVLTLPAIRVGLLIDDYFHRSILLGTGRIGASARPLLDLFAFAPGHGPMHDGVESLGIFGWWSHPNLSLALFRPVSALTHILDYALWPDAFVVQHLHSLFWYGLAVFAVAQMYRRVNGATAVAGLAAIFFAIDDAHAMCAGWIANRHALVSLAIGMFALQAHVRWRREGGTKWIVAAVGLLAASLLAGESGLAIVAYIAAWQLTMEDAPWRDRVAALLPYAVLVIAWRTAYDAMGYGTTGSALYVDPGHEPPEFLLAVIERWPILQLAQWFQVQSDPLLFLPRAWQISWAIVGGVVCVLLIRAFRSLLIARREARFWAVGMCLALVPLCAAFPMDRLLLVASVGAFALLAMYIEHVGLLPGGAPRRDTSPSLGRVLLVLHGPLAVFLLIARIETAFLFSAPVNAALASIPADTITHPQTAIFVNGHEVFIAYVPIILELENPDAPPLRVAQLASMFSDNVIVRESADTLVITPEGGFLRAALEQLVRSLDKPFTVGERIDRPEFTAEVRAVTADGRPETVAFHFRATLESNKFRWLAWTETGVGPFRLPAIGEQVRLPIVPIRSIGKHAPQS